MGSHIFWTKVHFIDFECTPRWDPEAYCFVLINDHHLMLQHNNARRPHVTRICTKFLQAAKKSQFLHGQHTCQTWHTVNTFGTFWIGVRGCGPLPTIIERLCTAIEEEWNKIPQAIISNLINSMPMRYIALHQENNYHRVTFFSVYTPLYIYSIVDIGHFVIKQMHWSLLGVPVEIYIRRNTDWRQVK